VLGDADSHDTAVKTACVVTPTYRSILMPRRERNRNIARQAFCMRSATHDEAQRPRWLSGSIPAFDTDRRVRGRPVRQQVGT
jgi:hypothetical protein